MVYNYITMMMGWTLEGLPDIQPSMLKHYRQYVKSESTKVCVSENIT